MADGWLTKHVRHVRVRSLYWPHIGQHNFQRTQTHYICCFLSLRLAVVFALLRRSDAKWAPKMTRLQQRPPDTKSHDRWMSRRGLSLPSSINFSTSRVGRVRMIRVMAGRCFVGLGLVGVPDAARGWPRARRASPSLPLMFVWVLSLVSLSCTVGGAPLATTVEAARSFRRDGDALRGGGRSASR